MDEYTKNAILSAIRTEKDSHEFYLLAANRIIDPATKQLLQNIADEEYEHLSGFLSIYGGNVAETASIFDEFPMCEPSGKWKLMELDRSIHNREEMLNFAMKEEQSCIDLYSAFVETVTIPEAQVMFKKALEQTRQHLETIEAEYARCMAMVDDSEMNTYVRE